MRSGPRGPVWDDSTVGADDPGAFPVTDDAAQRHRPAAFHRSVSVGKVGRDPPGACEDALFRCSRLSILGVSGRRGLVDVATRSSGLRMRRASTRPRTTGWPSLPSSCNGARAEPQESSSRFDTRRRGRARLRPQAARRHRCRLDFGHVPVAQRTEQPPSKRKVPGSNPGGGATTGPMPWTKHARSSRSSLATRRDRGSPPSWRAPALYLPVVVVDDGSTDDTAAQAEAAGATVLVQRPNAGKGAALRAGFRHALETVRRRS